MSTGRSRDLRVLVACEFSGIVRDAFLERGHNAWSCDLLPSESLPQYHMRCDVFEAISRGPWDLMIAFPPCTHLASSGARWFKNKRAEQDRAIEFVINLWASPIPHFAIENPIGVLSTRIGKPDQIIQPWQFGHGETKATCLWLWNLPKLTPTDVVEGREGRVWKEAPGPDRWKNRSRTLPGIAAAMADQWGRYVKAQIRKSA